MTVITLATIGYGETHPLSQMGRAFTLALIFIGVGLGTVLIGTAWQAILEGQFVRLFDRRRKMAEVVEKLKGHTIFCGFSRLGRIAAEELRRNGTEIAIIESNEQRANDADDCGFLVVRGDATLDDSLATAGLSRAKRLISLLPRDSDNLYVILTAREMNPDLYIVSRAEDELGEKRLKRAGVDKIISTHRLAARKLADGLLRPNVTDFFEIAGTGEDGWKIEEIRVPSGSPVCGQTLRDLSLRQTAKVGIAGVVSPQGSLEVNPSGDTKLQSGSTLIVIGWKSDITSLEKFVLAD
jgi:voltage-gated potassium channel